MKEPTTTDIETASVPLDLVTEEAGEQSLAIANNEITLRKGAKFRIPFDKVAEATRDLPDDHRAALKWLHAYCHDNDLDSAAQGKLIKQPNGEYYSSNSIYQVLTGRRETKLDKFVQAIESFRRVIDVRSEMVTNGFIETRLSGLIFESCQRALHRGKIAPIFGDSHIGKSWALQEYTKRNNHGQTIYVDFPSTGGLWSFIVALAARLRGPEQFRRQDARPRIFTAFDDRMLLIVDNVHRAFHTTTRGLAVFDFLQELFDTKHCGMVLAMTNEGRDELVDGVHLKRLEQIRRRCIPALQLPNITPDDDLVLFAKAYGLPPAPDAIVEIKYSFINTGGVDETVKHSDSPYRLQSEVNTAHGIGVWVSRLQDASDMAVAAKKPISWGMVIKADAIAKANATPVA